MLRCGYGSYLLDLLSPDMISETTGLRYRIQSSRTLDAGYRTDKAADVLRCNAINPQWYYLCDLRPKKNC